MVGVMKRWIALVVAATVLAFGIGLRSDWTKIDTRLWQQQVSPGSLSASHSRLENNCAACHSPVHSAEPTKCIGCHANDTALLQRQPTAFHASIGACSRCHIEHQGATPRPLPMDHATLANIGLEVVRSNPDNASNGRLLAWVRQHQETPETLPTHPGVTPTEAALNCVTCHSTKDRHQGYFGADCASCHRTTSWTIAEFQHPSPRSVTCVQCHQPPPSHSMMHFTMVSQSVAKRSDARVDQCFLCHQTTSWNDIQRVGWYKHH
jgi:hypothetical protein